MKTPEELILIGGGILISSGLIFSLKGQIANILPQVDGKVQATFQGKSSSSNSSNNGQQNNNDQAQDLQNDFEKNFQQAQQNHWSTGYWGTSQYYIDNDNNMHVGTGRLSGSLNRAVGNQAFFQLKSVSLDASIQAPSSSYGLFAGGDANNSLTHIYHLDRLDTSQATNMGLMFAEEESLSNPDVSHFDTSHVTDMEDMFYEDGNINDINVSHFNTSQVNNMNSMFYYTNLSHINLSSFDTSNIKDSNATSQMFYSNNNLNSITLGNHSVFHGDDGYYSGIPMDDWTNGQQVLNSAGVMGDSAHPGTWTVHYSN